jgi:hypothetical protein
MCFAQRASKIRRKRLSSRQDAQFGDISDEPSSDSISDDLVAEEDFDMPDKKRATVKHRGDINILLCGDPGNNSFKHAACGTVSVFSFVIQELLRVRCCHTYTS